MTIFGKENELVTTKEVESNESFLEKKRKKRVQSHSQFSSLDNFYFVL